MVRARSGQGLSEGKILKCTREAVVLQNINIRRGAGKVY